ncbi:MAG: hypothetical protein GKS06_17775 [Acidobacteria bacterium]|nr:hypothetical protein [Acidobacteriota bacterium]
MNIDWTFRGEPIADEARQRVDDQLHKIARLLREPTDAHVVVGHEGPTHQRVDLEVVLTSPEGTFKGHGESHDLDELVRDVLHRIDAQVHKAHDKRLEARRHSGAPTPTAEGQ